MEADNSLLVNKKCPVTMKDVSCDAFSMANSACGCSKCALPFQIRREVERSLTDSECRICLDSVWFAGYTLHVL